MENVKIGGKDGGKEGGRDDGKDGDIDSGQDGGRDSGIDDSENNVGGEVVERLTLGCFRVCFLTDRRKNQHW